MAEKDPTVVTPSSHFRVTHRSISIYIPVTPLVIMYSILFYSFLNPIKSQFFFHSSLHQVPLSILILVDFLLFYYCIFIYNNFLLFPSHVPSCRGLVGGMSYLSSNLCRFAFFVLLKNCKFNSMFFLFCFLLCFVCVCFF